MCLSQVDNFARRIKVKITFLGTGTSHGVPVVGCDCDVCKSNDRRNNRTRSSIWVQVNDVNLLIDTANEFRIQALRSGIKTIDAVLYTHCHADHVFGFDDLRIFSQRSGKPIPYFGNRETLAEIKQVFSYVFRKTQIGGGKPQVKPIVVEQEFAFGGVKIMPIPIYHGMLPIYGYRIGNMAYITDCSKLPAESKQLLLGLEVLILGVVRYQPHPTHMHVEAALELVDSLSPQRTFFTHVSHLLEHNEVNSKLPPGVELAYDGLTIKI